MIDNGGKIKALLTNKTATFNKRLDPSCNRVFYVATNRAARRFISSDALSGYADRHSLIIRIDDLMDVHEVG